MTAGPSSHPVEAEKANVEQGERLGMVGGRIAAEVLVGLPEGDLQSYLRRNPAWKPILPSARRATSRWPTS